MNKTSLKSRIVRYVSRKGDWVNGATIERLAMGVENWQTRVYLNAKKREASITAIRDYPKRPKNHLKCRQRN